MFKNTLLLVALAMTIGVSIWGMVDTQGLSNFAAGYVKITLRSRGWFVMLTVSTLLISSLILAFSRYGCIRLGQDEEKPEFSTLSWLTMMFAAGMGVGLLFYGAAEPISHYLFLCKQAEQTPRMANHALLITLFNWGLHAWAIYGIIALVIAYFGFRKGAPQLISGPIRSTFDDHPVALGAGWVVDLLAMFSTGGSENPPVKIKLIWGVILGALGLVMILSGSVGAIRNIIAMSAGPFVFIVLLLLLCLLKSLKREGASNHANTL